MRNITVDVIASEEFKIVPQGYDQKQVDDFLNEICDYLEFGIGQQNGQANDSAKDAEIARLNMEKSQLEAKLSSMSVSASNQMELDRKDNEINKLNAEISRLQGLVKTAQQESAQARAKLEMSPKGEIEVSSERSTQLLISAQKLYDTTVAQAKEEAIQIKEKAQKEADEQLGSLKEDKEKLENELNELKNRFTSYLDNLDDMLKSQQNVLDDSRKRL